MNPPKHSKAAIKAHPAPVRDSFKTGEAYAEACRLVSEARDKFDNPLKLNGKEWDKEAVVSIVCTRIATSNRGIAKVLEEDYQGNKLPDYATWMRWVAADESICDRYTRAKEDQADFMADEILSISDEGGFEPVLVEGIPLMVDGKPVMAVSNAAVSQAKLRVETRKWLASKLKPKKYGDRLNLDADVKVSDMSDEQVTAKLSALIAKATSKPA